MLVNRETFLHFVAALAVAGCGASNPPPEAPVTVTNAPAATPAAPVAAPPLAATSATDAAPSSGIDFLDEPDYPSLPGPTCEAALTTPMPGRDEDHPHVHMGSETINGRLDPANVRAAVKRQGSAVAACFASEPDGARRSVKAIVKEDGSHEIVAASGADRVQTCLESAIAKVTFDKPASGVVTMVLPFERRDRLFVPDTAKLRDWEAKINKPCKTKHR